LKALGMGAADLDRFAERLPPDELDESGAIPAHLLPERYQAAVPLLERLVGQPQRLSVHPGGVVIAPPPLDRHTPLERAVKGVLVTQFDKRSLAALGLVKIDLLGNRALAAMEETLSYAGPQHIPDGDPATLELLRRAATVGCFQIETPAVRSTLRKMPVRGIKDVIAALAIVRPGPAAGEAKLAFIRRANGEEPPRAPHQRLMARLAETYGLLLYEEDLMAAITALTGWSLEHADEMRAELIAAGGNRDELTSLERSFTAAAGHAGVPVAEAALVWTDLVRFAAYSFPAHSPARRSITMEANTRSGPSWPSSPDWGYASRDRTSTTPRRRTPWSTGRCGSVCVR
jgi:DNA polymerase III alpha subunit